MDFATLQKKTDNELAELVKKERETRRNFRFGMAGSAAHDLKAARVAKQTIARALTILQQRHTNPS